MARSCGFRVTAVHQSTCAYAREDADTLNTQSFERAGRPESSAARARTNAGAGGEPGPED